MKTVAIVGVGLIGGSFALALRKAGYEGRIIGVSSPRTIAEALRLGVIDEALPLEKAATESDLIYLAQPISRILETIGRIGPHLKPGSLVTDAGSTKVAIVAEAARHLTRTEFLGGHPMAGKESRGVGAADALLFEDRPYVVTPVDDNQLETPIAVEFLSWIDRIGAHALALSPQRHDRVVALASHLPQLASTALAAALDRQETRAEIGKVAGPGLLDSTRLALSAYDIWTDIIATNRDAIVEALGEYVRELERIRDELGQGAAKNSDMEHRFRAAAAMAGDLRKPRC